MNLHTLSALRLSLAALALSCFANLPLATQAEERPTTVHTTATDAVVMMIDGEPVTTAEYTLVMRERVAEVFNYFHEKSGLEDRLGYWKDDGQSENPIRKLRERVANELKQIKTVQRLAKQKGVVRDISFQAFKERLTHENIRRLKALDQKQVVYGPKQYDETRYYYFKQADWDQELQDALAKEPALAVSDAEVEQFFASRKDFVAERPLSDVRHRIIATLQAQKYRALIAEHVAKAKVEIDITVLSAISPRHDP